MKTAHQLSVEQFMRLAKQEVPSTPTEPSEEVRLLRAKLIFEEAMETIKALGVVASISLGCDEYIDVDEFPVFSARGKFNMVEVIDGCCDIKVVITGTLIACGIPDEPFQVLVDQNNLEKFGPGHSWRDDGKLIKPPGHKPPDIAGRLEEVTKSMKLMQ